MCPRVNFFLIGHRPSIARKLLNADWKGQVWNMLFPVVLEYHPTSEHATRFARCRPDAGEVLSARHVDTVMAFHVDGNVR